MSEMEAPRFAPIRMDKFVVLNLATFGLYQIVWSYRCWRYVKRAEGSTIWPWARALFNPLMYHSLLQHVDGVDGKGALAVLYLVLSAAWRLPDPWWLVSLLSFVALMPAVRAMNDLNRDVEELPASAGWRTRDGAVLAGGAVALPLALLGLFGPSTAVVRGHAVADSHVEYLLEIGALTEEEELLYFYSEGLTSIRGTGVVITDQGVTSYWTDPVTEELDAAGLTYAQIASIEVNRASTPLGDTVVRITAHDGSWFLFALSAEEDLDREVIDEIEKRRAASGVGAITA